MFVCRFESAPWTVEVYTMSGQVPTSAIHFPCLQRVSSVCPFCLNIPWLGPSSYQRPAIVINGMFPSVQSPFHAYKESLQFVHFVHFPWLGPSSYQRPAIVIDDRHVPTSSVPLPCLQRVSSVCPICLNVPWLEPSSYQRPAIVINDWTCSLQCSPHPTCT